MWIEIIRVVHASEAASPRWFW